ncbi:MAG: hypothetical protein Q9169_001933 [Polycauliona sp. 2 TL-2023]
MKLTGFTFILSTTFATLALTQGAEDPGPSPTASIGCEPHGDHCQELTTAFFRGRHCDGPRPAGVATTTSAAAAAAQDEGTGTPASPPPTESVGCEIHGDHYHCDGPATGAATATGTSTAEAAEEGEEHDHENEGETLSTPPPTESVGCVAHGDHYDCEGPASAAQATAPPTTTGSVGSTNATSAGTEEAPPVPFEGAASNSRALSLAAVTGLVGAIALMVVV